MDKYEVVVGNIGTVYSGNDESEANAKWNSYVAASRESYGRASGETVTWLEDGEIRCESDGSLYLRSWNTTETDNF